MSEPPDRRAAALSAGARVPGPTIARPAARAAGRVAGAAWVLGVLGLGSVLLVLLRLVQRWRIEPGSAARHLTVLGVRLSYPTANAAAVVVLCQAVLGLASLVLAVRAAAREVLASRRLQARLRSILVGVRDDALVIDDDEPLAFCAGLLAPRVYVSTGALAALDADALAVVLEHEREHRRRRDPLRLGAGRVLAHALFFVPGLHALGDRHRSLAELGADERAIGEEPARRRALARAMLAFAGGPGAADGAGIDPARADALLGRPGDLGFPLLLCAGAAAMLAVMILIGVLAGRLAAGAATLAPPFLSGQPCILVLAVVPAVLGWVAWRVGARPGSR